MPGAHLSVSIHPEPGDDQVLDRIRELLRERGARPDGDDHFRDRRRRMWLHRADSGAVEIIMPAGPFDGPDGTRREKVTFARHLIDLLVAVTERTRPRYGGIGIEDILPTPAALRAGIPTQGYVTDPLFVRRDLLDDEALNTALNSDFRRIIPGTAGTVFASWWPFADESPATPGGLPIHGTWATGRLLGRAAR